MIELSNYHEGFIAGFAPGMGLGLGLMKMAWDHDNRHRRIAPPGRERDWRRSFNHENTKGPIGAPPLKLRRSGEGGPGPNTPKPPITPAGQRGGHHRWFINNPVQIAECGGPCTEGPQHCDCGALWMDVPKLPPSAP